MNKKNKIKKLLDESSSTMVDKIASLKYVTKKDSALIMTCQESLSFT